MVALADQKGKSLEQIHIFALAHILRRPVIVYGVKIVKNFRGENLGFANFEGEWICLTLQWTPSGVTGDYRLLFRCPVQGCTYHSCGRPVFAGRALWPLPTPEATSQHSSACPLHNPLGKERGPTNHMMVM